MDNQESNNQISPQTQPPVKPSLSKSLVIGLVVGIVVLLVVVVYMFTAKKAVSPVNNQDQQNQIANNQDEKENWKTYKFAEYGFEIQVPSDWELRQPKPGVSHFVSVLGEQRSKEQEEKCVKNLINADPSICAIPYEPDLIFVTLNPLVPILNKDNSANIIINNLKWEKYQLGDSWSTIYYDFLVGKEIFSFSSKDESKLKQVLSTFEFIENEETADWKTYRNEQYEFEIKHPPTWQIDGNRSTNQTIVFDTDTNIAESRDSITVQVANVSLEEWKNNLDQSVIISSQFVTIGENRWLRVNTGEFGLKLLAIIHIDKLYIITTSGMMLENKMIDTFKFTN